MTANVIIKQVLLRRGTTANTSVYVGPIGEAVVDTDLKTIRVQDGYTPGGTLLASVNDFSGMSANISSLTAGATAANIKIATLQANAAAQAVAITNAQSDTANLAIGITAANTAMKGYVDTKVTTLTANAGAQQTQINTLLANAVTQGTEIVNLWGNALSQHQTLANLISNAGVQGEMIDYLYGNALFQNSEILSLWANAGVQGSNINGLWANAGYQGDQILSLWANSAAQAQALNNSSSDEAALWANAAIQENEISSLRANISAANTAIITANTNLKTYTDYRIGSRTGEITFSGRTINANIVGNVSGIDVAAETRFAQHVGFFNDDPQHPVDVGDGTAEAPLNTGSIGLGFNNGLDTLKQHAAITWDWYDTSSLGGTHNDGSGTHKRLVIIPENNFDKPYISFDAVTGNAVVGNLTTSILNSTVGHFSGNTYSSYVIFDNDVKYSNGTPYMSGISARLNAANVASANYTDTKISALVGSAPAVLDTLYEIADSLGNNASLSTTLLNLIASTNSNVSVANIRIDTIDSNVGMLWANAGTQVDQITSLFSNAVAQGNQITSLWANAVAQNTYINELRANITSANTAIINNLAYTNQLNTAVVANVIGANSAIITANTAMKGYVDDHIVLALGNLEIQDTTITTKVGHTQTIILDAGGEIVLRDYTGIRNENPGYWLHLGDALDTSGTAHTGQFAIDYSDGMANGLPSLGQHGSVVFDYLWWSNVGGGHGNYNVTGGPSRRFGLLKDGDYPQYSNEQFKPYFTVDLDTKIFRVNSLQSGTSILGANVYSTGNVTATNIFTGNITTDGYFFANGAPLVIPPLVQTGNTAPTAEEGATEGALWWNDEDGRAYIKYGNIWVDFSPPVLPPVSRYVGNVTFYNRTVSNIGNMTPHTTQTYDLGSVSHRWRTIYVDDMIAAGNVSIGQNLEIGQTLDVGMITNLGDNLNVSGSATIDSYVDIGSNASIASDLAVTGNLSVNGISTVGNVSIGGNLFVYGNVTNISTTSLVIDDSLIYMANNNPGNSIDIGTVGNFNNGTYQHTGFVRDASDGAWKLFSNVIAEPTTTVDFTNAVYDPIVTGDITSPTISDLRANINAANAAIITANTATNNRLTDINSAMVANITATNAAIVTANTATNNRLTDINSAMVANITATNAAIVTANTAVVNYTNDVAGLLVSYITAANSAIVTANTDMKSYVDTINSTLTNKVNAANAAIVTANTGVVSYVNTINSSLTNSVNAANSAIVTANTALKSYTDTQLALKASAANPTFTGTATFSTPGNVSINGNVTIDHNAIVLGNLQVQGTTTTINQTSLTLTDKFITMANGSPSASAANNSGLFVYGANANVLYKSSNDSWTFNKQPYYDANVIYHAGNFPGAAVASAIGTDGTFYPTSGSGTAGIIFPTLVDGDYAYIKYYTGPGSPENILEIGVYCDDTPDENIKLNAALVDVVNDISVTGAIRPSLGSGSTSGIIFPDNPGAGSGDTASIKYYASTGEATVLELKVTNDANDNIKLNASGIVDITNILSVQGSTVLHGVSEAFSGLSAASGVVNHNCANGTIFYHTSIAGNFTVNLTNLPCDASYSTAVTLVLSQGGTAYIPNALQIAGAAQTINWQGGSAPTGNANKKDIVSFSILNSAGTYIVFGQLVSFG